MTNPNDGVKRFRAIKLNPIFRHDDEEVNAVLASDHDAAMAKKDSIIDRLKTNLRSETLNVCSLSEALADEAKELAAARAEVAELKARAFDCNDCVSGNAQRETIAALTKELAEAKAQLGDHLITKFTNGALKVELATARLVNAKLREQRNNLIERDNLGQALSDMTLKEMQAAYDAEIEALTGGSCAQK